MKAAYQANGETVCTLMTFISQINHPASNDQEAVALSNQVRSTLAGIEAEVNRAIKRGEFQCLTSVLTDNIPMRANAIVHYLLEHLSNLGYTAEVVNYTGKFVHAGMSEDSPQVYLNHALFSLKW